MVPRGRLALILVGTAATAAGLGFGAAFQHERYLGPAGSQNAGINLGDAIVFTAIPAAFGLLLIILAVAGPPRDALLGRPPRRWTPRPATLARFGAAILFLGASYLTVNLLQTAWPSVLAGDVHDASGVPGQPLPYHMSIGLLASNSGVMPWVLAPVLAVVVAGVLAMVWSGRLLVRGAAPLKVDASRQAVALQVGALGLAAPFLAIAGWGALRAAVALPASANSGPFQLALPLAALACLGILVTSTLKTWHLARAIREPLRAPVALDFWQGIGRIEAGLAAVLVVVAAAALVLPKVTLTGLAEGNAPFGLVNLNTALVANLLLAIPAVPLVLLHRRFVRVLARQAERPAPTPIRATVVWGVPIAAAACFVLAGAVTWTDSRALWAWLAAAAPLAIASLFVAEPVAAAPALLLCAGALWGIGNTVYATYVPSENGLAAFDTSPGELVLWRVCGALVAALAIARVARRAAPDTRPSSALPLAIGIAMAAATVAFLELPLAAGRDDAFGGSAIQVGSMLAASDAGVQSFYHGLASVVLLAGVLMLARLLRPEWFRPGRRRAAPDADVHPIA
ncbi:MAG: hypothetical protein V4510_07350 [bacterium]